MLYPSDIGGCPEYCCFPPGNSHSILDHEVLLAGFGTEVKSDPSKNIEFWKLKNSWGPKWGDGGYFRVRQGKNVMGLNSDVAHSSVE